MSHATTPLVYGAGVSIEHNGLLLTSAGQAHTCQPRTVNPFTGGANRSPQEIRYMLYIGLSRHGQFLEGSDTTVIKAVQNEPQFKALEAAKPVCFKLFNRSQRLDYYHERKSYVEEVLNITIGE